MGSHKFLSFFCQDELNAESLEALSSDGEVRTY